ncbi:hypothetical protein NHX12_024556 [Muraenolepis orangiensis]|uniref:Complement component C9 n=1 Tax=Muraenolepis orangiensis TaxID=630683 RepID=A0A9Q0EL71_9TELE|nr:hypothetical protein NHX12_024556 [Muraenolepis orangiensis]
MKTGNAMQLGFYGLFLTLTFFGHGTGVQLPEPPPVNCFYNNWSGWTPCNPCTNMRWRSRGIEAFGQFKGQPCQESLGESEACVSNTPCAQLPTANCASADFQCGSGACIKKRLTCNYDFDCEDQTDEVDCERMSRKPCGTRLLDSKDHGRTTLGQGINIFGSTPPKKLFYNDFFNGACQVVGSTGIRLPWNIAALNLETGAEKTVSTGVHESGRNFVVKVLAESSYNIAGGLSFKYNKTRNVIKDIVESTETGRNTFVRINGKLQLATYRLRPRDLKLANGFSKDLRSLPVEYEKGAYFDLIEDYGTHYPRSGRLGGEYDLIYVLNSDEIKTEWKAVVAKVFISVKGGDSASTAAMEEQINMDRQLSAETYQNWARSITNYPGLIYSEREPIYNIIPLDMPDANARVSNMKRAIADYVAEYNVCKCKPCHNNGTVVLIDGSCSCLCTHPYQGLACQNRKAAKVPPKGSAVCSGGVDEEEEC